MCNKTTIIFNRLVVNCSSPLVIYTKKHIFFFLIENIKYCFMIYKLCVTVFENVRLRCLLRFKIAFRFTRFAKCAEIFWRSRGRRRGRCPSQRARDFVRPIGPTCVTTSCRHVLFRRCRYIRSRTSCRRVSSYFTRKSVLRRDR